MKKTTPVDFRCDLLKRISGATWGRVTRAHKVGVNLHEDGVTADIIADILWQFNKKGKKIGVFVQRSWNETIYGGDIDFFVEVLPDQYVWFAMQAKLLKVGNVYDQLKYNPAETPQWDSLKKLQRLVKCKAYYLLYNGNNIIKKRPLDMCGNKISKTQYGCSLVEVEKIEEVAMECSKHQTKLYPSFEDFHPDFAQPWKILTCCDFSSNLSTYSLADIVKSMKLKREKYEKLATFGRMNDTPDDDSEISKNSIADASEIAGWEPVVKFIIPKFNL